MEHPELIENAFVNHLSSLNVWTAGLQILAGENNIDKSGARIVAVVDGDLGNEDPPLSGNRWADVLVELRTPFSKATPSPLVAHQANAAALQTALTATGLPESLTAAQAGFTCFGLGERTPGREQKPEYWSSYWTIRIYSCPSTIAA